MLREKISVAETTNPYPKPRFLAVVIAITGRVLLVLGGELIGAGGSFYYAIAGLALGACGVMLFRGDCRGAQLYGLFLLGTFAWDAIFFKVRSGQMGYSSYWPPVSGSTSMAYRCMSH